MTKIILMQFAAAAALLPVLVFISGNIVAAPFVLLEYAAVRTKYGKKFLREFYRSHCELESTIYSH